MLNVTVYQILPEFLAVTCRLLSKLPFGAFIRDPFASVWFWLEDSK